MNETLQQATNHALDFLMTLDGVQPADAQRRLRAIQSEHPDIGLELVWEQESFDGSLHYDVLVRADGATVSVSFCRDGALPWPLRGVRRWSDADLMQVNGRILTMQDAVALLDVVWREAPILERLVDVSLIRDELDQRPIELSDVELQRGLDDLRRAHGLNEAAATERWMQARGLTHEQLEELINERVTMERLRDRVANGRVEAYFEAHRADFDTAHVVRVECLDEDEAQRIVDGDLDLFAAGKQQFLADPTKNRSLFATVRHCEIGYAEPGALSRQGRVVTQVLAVASARLDSATRSKVKDALLEEWLAERRRAAHVTWFWGTTDRTA